VVKEIPAEWLPVRWEMNRPAKPFFFVESTVTSINYLDMLQLWLMPKLQEDSEDFTFQ
jgi:hypothetical protein